MISEGTLKIAIIDDNPYPRSIVASFFKKKGIDEITEFSSPDHIKDEEYIFLELDFDSKMNGKKAIEFIKDNDLKKCIVVAFPGEEKIVEKAIDNGAVDFLMKPISEDSFERIYKKFFSK